MFLYCVQFKNRNDLVKIGVSKHPSKRLLDLSKVHGEVLKYKLYRGELYKNAERILHKKLEDYSVTIDGDGGTEFITLKQI